MLKYLKNFSLWSAIQTRDTLLTSLTGDLLCLPDEILIRIFSFLSPIELASLVFVCQKTRVLCEDNSLWESFCPRIIAEKGEINYKTRFKEQWEPLRGGVFSTVFSIIGNNNVGIKELSKSYLGDNISLIGSYLKKKYSNNLRKGNQFIICYRGDIARGQSRGWVKSAYKRVSCAIVIVNIDKNFLHMPDNWPLIFEGLNNQSSIVALIFTHQGKEKIIHTPEILKEFAKANNIDIFFSVNIFEEEEITFAFNTITEKVIAKYHLFNVPYANCIEKPSKMLNLG